MLDLVTISAVDFAASRAFYDATLDALGYARLDELVDEEEDDPVVEAAAWGPPDGPAMLWLVTGTEATRGLHLRLRADSRGQVETFHAAAIQAGGVAYAAPRRWPLYRHGEFNAVVRDPAGNLIEVVAPE